MSRGKRWMGLVVLAAICASATAFALEQPTTIPGEWKLYDAPLPAFETLQGKREPGRMVYGLYTWAGEYRTYHDGMRDVGWPSFRVAGPMNDETMALIARDGVEVMQTLGLRVHGDSKRRPDYESDEAFIADYVDGVRAYLALYGPNGSFFKDNADLPHNPIRHVEIWNEPNFQYMIPDDDSRPRQEVEAEREALYAKVLPAAYKAVKAQWPDVKVVGFGAGGSSHGDVRFIRHVHELNPEIAQSYDILSTHPYISTPPESWSIRSWGGYGTAQSVAEIREIMEQYGIDKPIWYTEVGWSISREEGGTYDLSGRRSTVSALLQGAYICRQYAMTLRRGVQRCHIMFAADTDNTNTGVFNRDGTWRASAAAINTMMRVLPEPVLLEAISDGEDGYFAYRIEGANGAPVVMAWNVAGPKVVEIPMAGNACMVVDMLGEGTRVQVTGGKARVEIGPCPVYVQAQ